jgi:hypothetical protein
VQAGVVSKAAPVAAQAEQFHELRDQAKLFGFVLVFRGRERGTIGIEKGEHGKSP